MKAYLPLVLSLLAFSAVAQNPKNMIKKLGADPVFFIDSVNVDKSELKNIRPTDVAIVSVYKDSNAIRLVGPEGKDGAIYIETKVFAKRKYWSFLCSKSDEYLKIVPDPASDTAIQYILNKRILTTNFEGDLALINDSTFKRITILDSSVLQSQYHISGKEHGVLVESDKPANLYHAKKKF
jgi:hypothetical protein